MVESITHKALKNGSAKELQHRGYEVDFEMSVQLYDRRAFIDVFGSKAEVKCVVECESSIYRYKILNRFSLLRTLEGENVFVLSLPVRLHDVLVRWIPRLRNIVDEVWLVNEEKEVVEIIIRPDRFTRKEDTCNKLSVKHHDDIYALEPSKILQFLMKNRNLVLRASGDVDIDLEVLGLQVHEAKKEKRDQTTQNNMLKFFSKLRDICLSQARMRIYVHLLQNQYMSACELHEELGIPKSTVFRELRHLQSMDLLRSSSSIPDRRGRPSTRYHIEDKQSREVIEALHTHV
jgi:predicted transcriptional regulator